MRVIHYYPFGYCFPVTNGADRVACNQLDYFRTSGFEVDCVFANIPDKAWARQPFRREYGWVNSVTCLEVPWHPHAHFRDQLFLYDRARTSPAFQALCSRPADLFFTNYAFTTPLALSFPPSCKRVVEMVDLMSLSFTQQEGPGAASAANLVLAQARQRFLFKLEVELCHAFDRVIMLSPTEYDAVRGPLGDRAAYVPQCVRDPGRLPDLVRDEPDDLLFVGSGHVPNIKGLDWFFRHVYLPHLSRKGVRLTVVGSVCDLVSFPAGSQVTKVPHFDGSLIDLYRRTKVVIVPLFEGTGVSIKSIEALAMGSCVVATAVGARGLPQNTDAVVRIDIPNDPVGTADVILKLLRSPPKRQARRVAARSLYEQHFHPKCYRARLDHVLELEKPRMRDIAEIGAPFPRDRGRYDPSARKRFAERHSPESVGVPE